MGVIPVDVVNVTQADRYVSPLLCPSTDLHRTCDTHFRQLTTPLRRLPGCQVLVRSAVSVLFSNTKSVQYATCWCFLVSRAMAINSNTRVGTYHFKSWTDRAVQLLKLGTARNVFCRPTFFGHRLHVTLNEHIPFVFVPLTTAYT